MALFIASIALMTACATEVIQVEEVKTTSAPPANGTVIRVVDWAAELQGEPAETFTASQGCVESNTAWPRKDVFRCFTDDSLIIDPCYSTGGRVLCPGDPFDRAFSAGEVTGLPATTSTADTSTEPWGVELTDGNKCRFSDGRTWPRNDMRLHYLCERGFLWGETDRSGEFWTLQFSETRNSALTTVRVAVAVW